MNGSFPHTSVGRLVLTPHPPKVHVEVDPQIVDFARALVPKSVTLNRTRFAPHITTVREEVVDPILWHASVVELQGREIPFSYDSSVVAGNLYWWLRVWSDDLIWVRRRLALTDLSWGCRPPDNEDCFHITIGNLKGLVTS